MNRPVLILRPEPGNSATCSKAREIGLNPVPLPLFVVDPVEWDAPDPQNYTAVMLTSANAARFAGQKLAGYTHLPCFAVGSATAALAREAGFTSLVTGEQTVAHLLATIATLGPQKILHLGGKDRVEAPSLGLDVDQRIVYRSIAVERDIAGVLPTSQLAICLIHSPRAGAHFAALCNAQDVARSTISIVAISEAAAKSVGGGWEKVAIAAKPRDDAMLQIALEIVQSG